MLAEWNEFRMTACQFGAGSKEGRQPFTFVLVIAGLKLFLFVVNITHVNRAFLEAAFWMILERFCKRGHVVVICLIQDV